MNGSSGFSLDTICLFLFEVVQSSKQGKLEGGYTRDGGGGVNNQLSFLVYRQMGL